MKKKSFVMVLALVLVFAVAVGGVVAWLTATTGPVKNTFTVGDINITLTESPNLDLKMVPGNDIKKDPTVTVVGGSEDCYLFVKVEKSANFDAFMTYAMANGWEMVSGTDNVYSRKVLATDAVKAFSVLAGDKVTVKTDVTKTDLNALAENTYPTLTFTAYAVQLHNGASADWSAAEAWTANFGA